MLCAVTYMVGYSLGHPNSQLLLLILLRDNSAQGSKFFLSRRAVTQLSSRELQRMRLLFSFICLLGVHRLLDVNAFAPGLDPQYRTTAMSLLPHERIINRGSIPGRLANDRKRSLTYF